jgi:hypothetical protein
VHVSPIQSPDGRPMFTAGGSRSYKTAQHRGFIVSLEWMRLNGKVQACMCIWPQSNVFVPGEGHGIWTISRRAITEFVGFTADGKCTGSASEHCYRECVLALPTLGKDRNDKQAFLALVDTVIRFAPDLVHMPATPKALRREGTSPQWEVTASNKSSGKTLSEAEV